MQLPGADRAIVDPFKVRNYLLATDHQVGRHKARFFASLRYSKRNCADLAAELRKYAQQDNATMLDANAYGTKYSITSPTTGPTGRSAVILSIWIVRYAETFPRLVTAYKGEIR